MIMSFRNFIRSIASISIMLCGVMNSAATAQVSDTLKVERRNQQNVLLNASSESQPRVISLGIPQWGFPIMEDGLPTSMYNDFFPGFWTWRGGSAIESMYLSSLDESALFLGNAGYYPISTSKMYSEQVEGSVNYSISHHGRNQIEANLTLPFGKGWGMNVNVYQDLNRGPNHLDVSYLQEHIQYYKAAVSKRLANGRGNIFVTYTYTKKFNISDPYGPFIFVGDGSIKQLDDFKLGKDQYLSSTSTFEYLDIIDGKLKERRYVEDAGTMAHIITFGSTYSFANNLKLSANSRIRLTNCNLTEMMLNSIEDASETVAYKYQDGTTYKGPVQTRYMLFHQDKCNEWFTTATLQGKHKKNEWNIGTNLWYNWTDNHIMTTNLAHEAQKNPEQLTYNGKLFYGHNTGAQFIDGTQSRLAMFGQNKWNISSRFSLRAGLRLEYSTIRGKGAHNTGENSNNSRTENWSLTTPGVTLTSVDTNNLNGAATLSAFYRFNKKWGLEVNAIATQQHAELWQFGEAELPTDLPKRNYLVRGGPSFKNKWIDIQSLLMYYQQDNNYYTALWTHELTKDTGKYPAGYKESIYMGSKYSMRVLAWTTDFILTPFKGFSLHGLFTLRSSKYMDYEFNPTFSDGYSETFDFSQKNITGTSGVEAEIEPSYEFNKWRIWSSFRYYSKQYVNITNSLYFNPRWESFAGLDFTMNKNVKFCLNVINFLNQTGANAGIQAASLTSDASLFKNYLTSGTFIRPFTIEFSTHIKF